MKTIIACLIFVAFCSPPVFRIAAAQQSLPLDNAASINQSETNGEQSFSPDAIERNLEGPVDADDIAAASDWAAASGVTLGAL